MKLSRIPINKKTFQTCPIKITQGPEPHFVQWLCKKCLLRNQILSGYIEYWHIYVYLIYEINRFYIFNLSNPHNQRKCRGCLLCVTHNSCVKLFWLIQNEVKVTKISPKENLLDVFRAIFFCLVSLANMFRLFQKRN